MNTSPRSDCWSNDIQMLNCAAPRATSRQFQAGARCSRPAALRHNRNTAPCLIALLLVLLVWPGSGLAQGNSGTLLQTINNPTPAYGDNFGQSVAAIGNDRVIVGANGGEEVYLFGLDGALLTTFTNPQTPGSFGGAFGGAVAGVWE